MAVIECSQIMSTYFSWTTSEQW